MDHIIHDIYTLNNIEYTCNVHLYIKASTEKIPVHLNVISSSSHCYLQFISGTGPTLRQAVQYIYRRYKARRYTMQMNHPLLVTFMWYILVEETIIIFFVKSNLTNHFVRNYLQEARNISQDCIPHILIVISNNLLSVYSILGLPHI